MGGLVIRLERKEEFPAIFDLVRIAFETAKVKDGDEQHYVDRLRASEDYIPELALVAEVDGRLAGHIMFTHVALKTGDGRAVRTLVLAPLSVVLEYRGRGIGGALLREGLRRAADMGFEGVFLAGDPAYYGHFGFTAASEFGVAYTGEIPPQFVLAYELRPGALADSSVNIEAHTKE